eukprot:4013771-Prymnesium_polylepis.2
MDIQRSTPPPATPADGHYSNDDADGGRGRRDTDNDNLAHSRAGKSVTSRSGQRRGGNFHD